MDKDDLTRIRKAAKDLMTGLRKMGRDMVDDNIPKAERFLTWVMYDQMVVKANNSLQDLLNALEEEL